MRDRTFKYHAMGYRHLLRNKSNRNKGVKRGWLLTHKADQMKARKYLPYYKKRKSTKQ